MKETDYAVIQQTIKNILDNYPDVLPTTEVITRTELSDLIAVFYLQAGRAKAVGVDLILSQAYAVGNVTETVSWILDKGGITCIIHDHKFKEHCLSDNPYFCDFEELDVDITNLLGAIETSFLNAIYA